MGYVNNLALLANSSVDVRRKLRILKDNCGKHMLHVNAQKTKILIFLRGRTPAIKEPFYYNKSPVDIVDRICFSVVFSFFGNFNINAKENLHKATIAAHNANQRKILKPERKK